MLTRKLTLLQGNDASVRFSCAACGFVAVGVVAVDGSELETVVDRHTGNNGRVVKKDAPRYNSPALADPMQDLPAEEYVPPKTDREAVTRAFGEIVEPDEFLAIIENGYDDGVTSGDWKAERRITPTRLKMGEIETIDVLVEFIRGADVVYACSHANTAGVPDFEKLKSDLRESCRFAIVGPRRGPAAPAPRAPRGPVVVESHGYHGQASVQTVPVDEEDAATRAALMRTLRGAM